MKKPRWMSKFTENNSNNTSSNNTKDAKDIKASNAKESRWISHNIAETKNSIRKLNEEKLNQKYNNGYIIIADIFSTSPDMYQENAVYHTHYHYYINPYYLRRLYKKNHKRFVDLLSVSDTAIGNEDFKSSNDTFKAPIEDRQVSQYYRVPLKRLTRKPCSFSDIIFSEQDIHNFLAQAKKDKSVLQDVIANGVIPIQKKWPFNIYKRLGNERH